MTNNKLPYSNQFECGHLFNWARKWTSVTDNKGFDTKTLVDNTTTNNYLIYG